MSASTTCSASRPDGAGVPQPEGRQPVRVDVLGRALQLGEGGDRRPARLGLVVVDLQQHRTVGLHHQGTAHRRLLPFFLAIPIVAEVGAGTGAPSMSGLLVLPRLEELDPLDLLEPELVDVGAVGAAQLHAAATHAQRQADEVDDAVVVAHPEADRQLLLHGELQRHSEHGGIAGELEPLDVVQLDLDVVGTRPQRGWRRGRATSSRAAPIAIPTVRHRNRSPGQG